MSKINGKCANCSCGGLGGRYCSLEIAKLRLVEVAFPKNDYDKKR